MRTMLVVVVDESLRDANSLCDLIGDLNVKRIDRFVSLSAASKVFFSNRSLYSRAVIFIKLNDPDAVDSFLKQAMQDDLMSEAQIIVVENDQDEHVAISAIQAGAVGYLRKPFDKQKIGNLLNQSRLRQNRVS